jgi:hypothetical protein
MPPLRLTLIATIPVNMHDFRLNGKVLRLNDTLAYPHGYLRKHASILAAAQAHFIS